MPRSSKVSELLQVVHLAHLTPTELRELATAITSYADALDVTDQNSNANPKENRSVNSNHASAGVARGSWVESRLVRGCGPYLYLRWREGGKVRSRYLGKASDYEP